MNKSRNHRKRHVPPGPVGVWFRTQQQQLQSKREGNDNTSSATQRSSTEDSRCDASHSEKSNKKKQSKDNSFSPVWSKVQEDLELDTPYLHGDPKQKYDELRPRLPRSFILLREILLGDYDFAIPPGFHLLLLVNAIESHNLHSICTIELHDETGLSVRAWVEPRFVQEQMQKQQESSVIRTGVVWMLEGVGVMVQMNEDDEEVERILLIGRKHLAKVWTPEEAKTMDLLQHMERKNATSRRRNSETVDEIGGFQDSPVESVNQIGEKSVQENRYEDEAADVTPCAIAQNEMPSTANKGKGEISQAANSSRPLHLVQTNCSTSQRRECKALVHNTANSPDIPIEENPAAPTQRSKEGRLPGGLSGNGIHRDPSSRNMYMNAKDSAAKKRRKRSGFSPERSSQQQGGASTTNISSAGCLWDNVNGDAALQLFDENDDYQTNVAGHQSIQANAPSLQSRASKHHEEASTLQYMRTHNILQSESELSSSLFEASNLARIDLSAFDDDE